MDGLSRAAQEFVEEVYELRRTGRATTEKLAAAQGKLFASNFRRTFRCVACCCLSVCAVLTIPSNRSDNDRLVRLRPFVNFYMVAYDH